MVQGADALALQRRRLAAKSLSVRRRVDGLLSTLRDPVDPDFFVSGISERGQVGLVLGFWASLLTEEERQRIISTLLEIDCIPVAMEMFTASDDTQWDLIQSVIDDCDYYIVVIKNRYGSLAPDGVSYTEKEFDYAVEKGIPVLGFLHADPGSVPARQSETKHGIQKKLEAFRKKINDRMRREWSSPGELAGAVSSSLHREMKRRPRPGWVRATDETNPSAVNRLYAKVAELEGKLKAYESGGATGEDSVDWDPLKPIEFAFTIKGQARPTSKSVDLKDIFTYLGTRLRRGLSATSLRGSMRAYASSQFARDVPANEISVSHATCERIVSNLELPGVVVHDVRTPYGRSPQTTESFYTLTTKGEKVYLHLMAEESGG